MNMKLVYTINLVLIVNCVIIVAKNETESEKKLESQLNQKIYAEGFSQHDNEIDNEHKPRIKGRKGVIDNEISNPATNEIKIDDDSAKAQNVSTTPAPSTVHNINSTLLSVNVTTGKPNIDQKTTTIAPLSSINNSTNSTITPKAKIVTSTTLKTTIMSSSTTIKTTTTTKKPVKKPEVTYSADDNPEILESEKKINYNVANEKALEIPKVESDIDRSILDEKRARNSYMIYLGLVFALPMSFVLINIAYKRIKNYMELRHYQRVDFLVDGMYVS
ncbi:hypothetical protein PVAND_012915 [Polypedilum vanderplanki]|uniref:Uncharacterized protein n=1 Tax=Polypedilum vanderplanki TaxID=319348 RepID=A0A9J6CP17_POLVA|nr:hypothetical protein PVAND_012915 [Polypedilum vanderplanki]